MKHVLLCFSLCACGLAANAQTNAQPVLVSDINTGINGSFPSRLTSFNDKLVFFAGDAANGNELWAKDSLTYMVYNINPGSASSGAIANYTNMAVANGKVYFPADDGTTGQELYSWDGNTAMPPLMVKDINISGTPSQMNEVAVLGDRVYFPIYTSTYGVELWMHDTKTLNTGIVANISASTTSSTPHNLIVYKGMLYFSATNTTTGAELYRYDPKTNNTSLVRDIETGINGSDPQSMIVIDGKLYFTAYTSAYGREIYSFDSTNILRLTDLATGGASGLISAAPGQKIMTWFNNYLYFTGDDGSTGSQLYRYNMQNGTAGLVYAINPTGASFPSSYTTYGPNLYFSAYDDTHGIELWRFDGMNAPEMVADIDAVGSGNPQSLTIHNNALYFSAHTQDTGTELYMLFDTAVLAGIKNVKFDAEVKVFPNPATSEAYIALELKNNETLSVAVTDMAGKTVFATAAQRYTAGSHKITVPMASLPAGTYMYRIDNEVRNCAAGKILKQ